MNFCKNAASMLTTFASKQRISFLALMLEGPVRSDRQFEIHLLTASPKKKKSDVEIHVTSGQAKHPVVLEASLSSLGCSLTDGQIRPRKANPTRNTPVELSDMVSAD